MARRIQEKLQSPFNLSGHEVFHDDQHRHRDEFDRLRSSGGDAA